MSNDRKLEICPECGEDAGTNGACRLCVVHDGRCGACEDATGGVCARHFDPTSESDWRWQL